MSTLNLVNLETLLGGLGLKTPVPQVTSAEVLNKPLDIGRSYLAEILVSLVDCDTATAYGSIQWPNNISNGDLAVILPKLKHGADANDLALELMQKFPECPLFLLPIPDGVHLRLIFQPRTLPRVLLPYIRDRNDNYGLDRSQGLEDTSSSTSTAKNVVVEFSSPNLTSEFQGKHLRSTILGAYISTLYKSFGWNVTQVNYLGDWGKPIGLLGVGWERFGSEEAFETDPVGHILEIHDKIQALFDPEQVASKKARDEGGDPAEIEAQGLFAERNAFFKRMEEGEEKAINLWKRVRDVNIENYTDLYSRMDITFDEYSGESQISLETMAEVEGILKEKGLCEESEGSWIIDMKKHTKKAGTVIIRDRTGSSTYTLRDLAAVLERDRKYKFDKMIYVVAADHSNHFSRLVNILELMDMADLAVKLQHISFNQASSMSEKLDHVHTLGDILDHVQKSMKQSLEENPDKAAVIGEIEEVAAELSVSALFAQEFTARRPNEHPFDIDRMTSFDFGTGADLRYWWSKLSSLPQSERSISELSDKESASIEKSDQLNLLRLLVQYPDITQAAYQSLEPAIIMNYLVNVIAQLTTCYKIEEKEGQPEANTPSESEMLLYEATKIVLENAMKLLRITPASQ